MRITAFVRRSARQRKKRGGSQLSVEQQAIRNAKIRNLELRDSSSESDFNSNKGMGSDYVFVLFSSLSPRDFKYVSSSCGVVVLM